LAARRFDRRLALDALQMREKFAEHRDMIRRGVRLRLGLRRFLGAHGAQHAVQTVHYSQSSLRRLARSRAAARALNSDSSRTKSSKRRAALAISRKVKVS